MESVEDRWYNVTHAGPETWLAWAAWLAIVITVLALIYLNRQLQRNRRLAAEQTRPQVSMFMEPHAADWHVIELVVRNFGKTPAYDVRFSFPHPPTVARDETASDGYAEVVALQLPDELPMLAPGQEWRTVWDSAIDRGEVGDAIESRFTGVVSYSDSPEQPRGWWPWRRERPRFENKVTLDWNELPPVKRVELLTNHDLAKREKQKLELLRSLLTYFYYASKETRPDVFRNEIERINRAARESQDRWRSLGQRADDTDVTVRLGDATAELGKHHS
ncbi:MAG TPA: hypothetical protein VFQ37_03090 [Mycobacterium sp.]|nr:hypothetical protein [Mycobacterium sp.]